MKTAAFLLLLCSLLSPATALVVQKKPVTSTGLAMAPRYDKTTNKWVPTSDAEMPSAGYPPIGSLLRQGPAPYFQRLFKTDEYEQAVLKFMAGDECSRNEAQGNMDAYLRNPSDWQYMRMESTRRGIKVDYAKLDKQAIVLTTVWSAVVLSIVGRVGYCVVVGESFWAFLV